MDTLEAFREAALLLAKQARRNLLLWTEDLEAGIYDTQDFAEAVVDLVKRRRDAKVWILLEDPTWVVHHRHPLVELAQKLSTFVQIRTPIEAYRHTEANILIADATGLLYRRRNRGYHGFVHFRLPRKARPLARQFMEAWENSLAIPDLRHLHL